jgi:dethiobiotin synthetase
LAHLDDARGTVADIGDSLHAPVLVVAASGLGTLNAIALTTEALRNRGLHCLGVVIGSWPADPDLAAPANIDDVPAMPTRRYSEHCRPGPSRLHPSEFLSIARTCLAPALGGTWRTAT